jgi:predicted esterase
MRIPHFQHLWQEATPPSKGTHLLITLHGRGGSFRDFEQLGEIWQIPGLCYLHLQAPDPFFGGWSWYDLPPNPGPGIERSRRLLTELMQALNAQGFPPERCIFFGFSQGCLMTLEFGLRYPDVLGGYIGICGQVYELWPLIHEANKAPLTRGRWLWSAGSQDEIFGIETSRIQARALQEAGADLEFHEWNKGHEIDHTQEIYFLKDWVVSCL